LDIVGDRGGYSSQKKMRRALEEANVDVDELDEREDVVPPQFLHENLHQRMSAKVSPNRQLLQIAVADELGDPFK
jgi:outer membrane lipopolysaccharide assembly protein LptE/RlpB